MPTNKTHSQISQICIIVSKRGDFKQCSEFGGLCTLCKDVYEDREKLKRYRQAELETKEEQP